MMLLTHSQLQFQEELLQGSVGVKRESLSLSGVGQKGGFKPSLEGWVRRGHQAYKGAPDQRPQEVLEPTTIHPNATAPAVGRQRRRCLDQVL